MGYGKRIEKGGGEGSSLGLGGGTVRVSVCDTHLCTVYHCFQLKFLGK